MTPPITTGRVRALAFRPVDSDPMREAPSVTVAPGRGIDRENRPAGKRELTLLSSESWFDACRELGRDIPWTCRRANVLVERLHLPDTIGKVLSIGTVRVQVHGETKPCGLMDKESQGLRIALQSEGRGGVHAEVLSGGVISVGDEVRVMPDSG